MQAQFNHTLTIRHILVPTLAQSLYKHTQTLAYPSNAMVYLAQSHHGTIKILVVTRGDAHSRQSEAVFITMFFLVLLHCRISWIFHEAGPDLVLQLHIHSSSLRLGIFCIALFCDDVHLGTLGSNQREPGGGGLAISCGARLSSHQARRRRQILCNA